MSTLDAHQLCDMMRSSDNIQQGTMMQSEILLRRTSVEKAMGLTRSTLYLRVRQGLLTPPVKIGVRASAWPDREISALVEARIAGKTDDQVRALVVRLVKGRAY